MADHILDDVDRDPFATIVDLDGLANPLRQNHAATGAAPCVGKLG